MLTSIELANKIMKLIEEGQEIINQQQIQSEAALFIGMSGVGKSTLINYISGVQLESFWDSGTYKLQAKDPSKELPGIRIGHSRTTSCTRYSKAHLSTGKTVSYIDTAGFGETGDLNTNSNISSTEAKLSKVAQDIANAYFRGAITEKANSIKVVLVIPYKDLEGRDGNLPKALKDFARFIQAIESDDPKVVDKIKNAISIIVTKGPDPLLRITALEKEIDEMKKAIISLGNNSTITTMNSWLQLKETELKDEKKKGDLSAEQQVEIMLVDFLETSPALQMIKNLEEILTHVVKNKQYAVFTTPPSPGDKTFDEAEKIRNVIEKKTTAISKVDANIGIKVSDEHSGEVLKAIDGLSVMSKRLAQCIDKDICKRLKIAFAVNRSIQDIKKGCETVKGYTTLRTLELFMNDLIKELKLSDKTQEEYKAFNKFLTFLVSLLPDEDRKKYSDKKNWINELGLIEILNSHIATTTDILSSPQFEFKHNKLTVRGYHLKMSQIDSEISKLTDIKSIEIHALHTLTIDNDLADNNDKCKGKLHGVNLTMIAHNIVVSGDRIIDLSGINGNSSPKAANGANGAHGADVGPGTPGNNGSSGAHGADGASGQNGESGGNLYIACNTCTDKEHLSVYLNGGNGAKGQEGGNGGRGGNGSGVTYLTVSFNIMGAKIEGISRQGWVATGGEERHRSGEIDQAIGLLGGDGAVGGNGGKGGKGGDGGKKGECIWLVADQLVEPGKKLYAEDGKFGTNGDAGEPGSGGAHGRRVDAVWRTSGGSDNGWHAWHKPHYVDRGSASNGSKLLTINENGWQAATSIPLQNFQLALLNYKFFIMQEITKHPKIVSEFLSKFKKSCENIRPINVKATVNDFLEEANSLEAYYAKHRKDFNFESLYYSLLLRIKDFAMDSARTAQEIKVLEYLYVATLGNLARLQAAEDNLLVVDVRGYVKNLVDRDFKDLQSFKANQLKTYYKQQYQEQIEGKIEEAHSFLDILREEIRMKQQAIQPQIDELEKEIKNVIMSGGVQLKALTGKRYELEEALRKKATFGFLSIAIQGIGMLFPPAGPIVAGVVNAGLSMVNNPSIETAINFASKVVEMKSQIGDLPKKVDSTTKHEIDLFKKVQEIAKTAALLIKDMQNLLSQKNSGENQLAQLDSEIIKLNTYIQELNIYLQTVPKALGTYLEGMVHEVESFQQALGDKSLVALEFSKLEMKHFFDRIKQNIKMMVGRFEASDGFQAIAVKLEEAMDVSINICGRIQDYRDHIAFANYIAHLQTDSVQAIDVGTTYQSDVDQLKLNIQRSIVQEAYFRAIAAIKQWAFPFAERFISAISDLETMDDAVMANNLPIILKKLNDYKTSITSMDQSIMLSSFDAKPTFPFFTWSYERYPQKIESLLKGEKVIFNANVQETSLDGIKFKKVGIKFSCKLTDKQAELDTELQGHYKVTLQHNGISYYRYLGNVYQISSNIPLQIGYSFKMRKDGETPEIYNEVWGKMAQGDILLSPYTSWIVQIEPVLATTATTNLFSKFNTVIQHFKISFTGEGSFVDTTKVNGDLHLNKYYRNVEDVELLESLSSSETVNSNKQEVPIDSSFSFFKSSPSSRFSGNNNAFQP